MSNDTPANRYARQIQFAPIGPSGHDSITKSRVAVLGCGALGTVAAEILARAGVGQLVTLLWLVNNLASMRGQRLEVDGGASLPSMGGAGDTGQVSPSVQVGSARSEE